jgi:ATP-dependent Clp protease ATP-binding subunit ClpC
VFERFTERARQVVVFAQDEARALGHNWIGTEHLLLGLLREEEGIAARVLQSRKLSLEEVRTEVGRIIGSRGEPPERQIPFTPRAKKTLELSLSEALQLGHNYIGPEHILLGLVREGGGVAARIMADAGASPRVVAEDVLELLGGAAAQPEYAEAFTGAVPTDIPLGKARAPVDAGIKFVGWQSALLIGWALFGLAFGVGLLAGWLIWG